jgi:hypothetical protein
VARPRGSAARDQQVQVPGEPRGVEQIEVVGVRLDDDRLFAIAMAERADTCLYLSTNVDRPVPSNGRITSRATLVSAPMSERRRCAVRPAARPLLSSGRFASTRETKLVS